MNVVCGNIEISDRYNSFEQFQNNIYEIYNLARENMNTRQKVSSTYYDKKVRDDKLDIGDKVFVYLPRNERAKSKYKWTGPCKIVEAHHPTYNVEMQTSKGVKHVWLVRNHLKRAPNHSELVDVDIENEKEVPVTMDFAETSSDKDENEEIQTEQRRYNFRTRTPAQRNYLYYCSNLFDI